MTFADELSVREGSSPVHMRHLELNFERPKLRLKNAHRSSSSPRLAPAEASAPDQKELARNSSYLRNAEISPVTAASAGAKRLSFTAEGLINRLVGMFCFGLIT